MDYAPIPGPPSYPLVGSMLSLRDEEAPVRAMERMADTYGPIYKLWLGQKLCVVVSSPSLAKEVVRDKDIIFSDRDPPIASQVFTYGGSDIAWSSYSPQWKEMRKVFVREMLSNANLEALL